MHRTCGTYEHMDSWSAANGTYGTASHPYDRYVHATLVDRITSISLRTAGGGCGCEHQYRRLRVEDVSGEVGRVSGDRHNGHMGGDCMLAMVYVHEAHVVCPFSQHVVIDVDISRHTGHSSARRTESDTDWMSSTATQPSAAVLRVEEEDAAAAAPSYCSWSHTMRRPGRLSTLPDVDATATREPPLAAATASMLGFSRVRLFCSTAFRSKNDATI